MKDEFIFLAAYLPLVALQGYFAGNIGIIVWDWPPWIPSVLGFLFPVFAVIGIIIIERAFRVYGDD